MEVLSDMGSTPIISTIIRDSTAAIRHYEKFGGKAVDSVENSIWNTDGESLNEIKLELSIC